MNQLFYLRLINNLCASMLTKNKIKFIRSLAIRKERYTQQRFIIEGEKIVKEAIEMGLPIEDIIALDSFSADLGSTIFISVSKKEIERCSSLKKAPGILATLPFMEWKELNKVNGKYILLDSVNDPGNLGTIIRIADWFGMDGVICSLNSVDVYNQKVVQASMGSIFRIPVYYMDLKEIIHSSPLPLIAASMQGEDFSTFSFPKSGMLLMGNESHGISNELLSLVDNEITIPRKGKAESLNVSVATGILCQAFAKN
jgi:TrmH family RNA methyltransferase